MEQSSQSLLDSAYKKIEAGDYNGARRDFRDLTGITPKDALDYVNRGLAHNGLGDYEKANEDYEKANKAYEKAAEFESDPEKKIALIKKSASISGLSHAASGRLMEASRREIEGEPPKNPDDQFNPKDKWDFYCRAIENKYLGKTDRAIDDFKEAIKIDKNFFYAHRRLADLYFEIREFTQAIDAYRVALLLNPDDARVINSLSTAHHLRGTDYIGKKDYKKAINDLTESIRLDPENSWTAHSHGNRGVAYYQNGEWGEAIRDFSWVIKNGGKDATVYLNRGMAYTKNKQPAEAIADLEKALELDPNDDYVKQKLAEAKRGIEELQL